MIERKFVAQRIRDNQIQEYMAKVLSKAGYSHTDIHNTPLGEKITVYTTRPGLVVGKSGENIKKITAYLKRTFKLENPQIEIGEVESPLLDVQYVADRIAYSLERFGSKRFKSIGYKMLQDIMDAGAMGAEIILSGKIPSARARSWRFSAGYLKKSGDIAVSKIKHAIINVRLKSGSVGIKVSVMTPDIELPDKLILPVDNEIKVEEIDQVKETKKEQKKEEKQKEEKKKEETKEKKEKKKEVNKDTKEKPKEIKKEKAKDGHHKKK
jgi:small subunit ribosomal protein S3